MASITDTAKSFFEACEAGKGWAACQAYLPSERDVLGAGGAAGGDTYAGPIR